jgi:hypothetical protein
MQFALPENLRLAVAQYDPALKAALAAEKRAKNPKKSSAPLGLPENLFPTEIMPAAMQAAMVKQINATEASNRHHHITRPLAECVLVHHLSMWLAAWVPTDPSADYLYGFKCVWKASPSTSNKVESVYTNNGNRSAMKEDCTEVKYGRTVFNEWGKVITTASVEAGEVYLPWHTLIERWGKHSTDKYRLAQRVLTENIKARLPQWDDTSGIFDRYIWQRNPARIAFEDTTQEWSEDTIMKRLNLDNKILSTPFFRREIARVMEEVRTKAIDPEVKSKGTVQKPWKYLKHQCTFARNFIELYPDASLDYIQQMYEIGHYCDSPYGMSSPTTRWIRKNIPVASWVKLFATFTESVKDNMGHEHSHFINTEHFRELHDTLNMLNTVLHHNNYEIDRVGRPDRWRISDFHDYFTAEAFKINNVNEALPQDLFPEPIKVDHLGARWTFFQPRDVHQLAQWGSAVRNCVGSASNYREGIKKKTHIIVLAMVDNRPQFTIQFRVVNNMMDVIQVAGVANKTLSPEERSAYELTFASALMKANESLKKVQP